MLINKEILYILDSTGASVPLLIKLVVLFSSFAVHALLVWFWSYLFLKGLARDERVLYPIG